MLHCGCFRSNQTSEARAQQVLRTHFLFVFLLVFVLRSRKRLKYLSRNHFLLLQQMIAENLAAINVTNIYARQSRCTGTRKAQW